ncbi:ABC transporter permease [Tuanshanicoccus lijuaniae]|uniref:ABC transporter permease n=1 Tax=Aerococcaceae bacterium zg-1292 TaxID=2774330 RepID=UPI0019384A9D|nr:ABC transporter permease [Aerococcaceae bacterium zg-1292]MBS4455645.1 ABC transporter permease [Aerococcaceae bacterium zg-A91]MBS4457264.1 ABC transporter permease [Aerococcaceae bacterium zg-BR33]QQA37731.1 ABC transporter permease [Aerococcaceae bacterium zg-1292]
MNQRKNHLLAIPYYLWIALFVITPILLLFFRSFLDTNNQFTLNNYIQFFTSGNYIRMAVSSVFYAFLVTLVTFMFAYPMAYFLSNTKNKQLWLMLIILPTWINLLLKTYAFIGLLSKTGPINHWLMNFGFGSQQLLFTNVAFLIVAAYIELPFMLLPIFNSIEEIPNSLIEASNDLGATPWVTIKNIVFPLSMRGVRSGVQAVFIPSLSLFMLTRLIGGNRVITLGTAVEQHFLVTRNQGMGSAIGVVLLVAMLIVMYVTRERHDKGGMLGE